MMQQKIVIKLQMDCESCRNKALKTAAEVEGVTAVSIEGEEKDRVVVTGDNVDTVCLANKLKKKFRCIIILSIEEVKKPKPEEKKKEEEKPKPACCSVICLPPPCNPCTKCHSPNCQGKCNPCSKCHSSKCNGQCVLICFKCHSPKCKCNSDACSKCQSPKCDGGCVTCTMCHSPKCRGQCTWSWKPLPPPSIGQCPPRCSCPRCYIPCPPCPPYNINVYDTCPDTTCSTM